MGTIRLHPKDRTKYNAPPEIPFDLTAVGVRQRTALERETKKPYGWFIDQLGGVPELDERGNPIPVPVVDGDGNPVFEADGVTPKVREKLTQDGDAIAMLVWLALWGISIKVPWDSFDVTASGLEIDLGGDDEGEPGKDEAATDSASTTTDPS